MNRRKIAAVYGALLTGFSAYVLLDTFVLAKSAQTGANQMNLSLFADEAAQKKDGSDAPQQTTAASAADGTSLNTRTTDSVNGTAAAVTAAGGTAEATAAEDSSEETEAASAKQNKTAAQTAAGGNTAQNTEPAKTEKTQQNTKQTTAETKPKETEPPQTEPPAPQYLNDATHYEDENIRIGISEYEIYETKVYVADIQLSSAQYLKTAFAKDTYGRNITAKTSVTAADNNAILAINGDFYGTHTHGYVIRNGVLYRDVKRDDTDYLCITADGSFFITTDDEYSAQDLIDMGVWQCFMFGPRLIENGAIMVDPDSEVSRAMPSNPRTAIGQIDDLHYVFVVSDGRTSESDGLKLEELAQFMQGLGVQTGYNLDGGGSSTFYFNGEILNNPTTWGKIQERSVSDIVYIGY